jgi:hypothetical protein
MATPILVNEIKATGRVLNNDVYVWRGGDTSFLYLNYSSSNVNIEGTDSSDHVFRMVVEATPRLMLRREMETIRL